jgi:hypothetical protein
VLVVVILGGFALAPAVMTLFGEGNLTMAELVASAATVALTIYAAHQQSKGNASAILLQKQNETNALLIAQLGSLVREGHDEVALMSLPQEIRDDNSPAGIAWKRIHNHTARAKYSQFRGDHGESGYASEADKRIAAIRDWENVDRSDPFDIYYFLRTSPFEALRREAEAAMKAAVGKANGKSRQHFWRQVGVPFHVLIPLLPLAYVAVVAVAACMYALAGHRVFSPYLAACSGAIARFAGRWKLAPYAETLRVPVAWTLQHLDMILRIALAGALAAIIGYALWLIIKAVVLGWIEPRVRDINETLDAENARSYEAVL